MYFQKGYCKNWKTEKMGIKNNLYKNDFLKRHVLRILWFQTLAMKHDGPDRLSSIRSYLTHP